MESRLHLPRLPGDLGGAHLQQLGLVHGPDRAAPIHEERAGIRNKPERAPDRDPLLHYVAVQHDPQQNSRHSAGEAQDNGDDGEEGRHVDRQRHPDGLFHYFVFHRVSAGIGGDADDGRHYQHWGDVLRILVESHRHCSQIRRDFDGSD